MYRTYLKACSLAQSQEIIGRSREYIEIYTEYSRRIFICSDISLSLFFSLSLSLSLSYIYAYIYIYILYSHSYYEYEPTGPAPGSKCPQMFGPNDLGPNGWAHCAWAQINAVIYRTKKERDRKV
jgi:hypothetical protein